MARTSEFKKEIITKQVIIETITCDKCGEEIDPEGDENFANVLEIYLNAEQCVNDRVRMDLCTECLEPVWKKICEAIGADPEAGELRIGQDD